MGSQIITCFEQAARVGGMRAKVRLAELTQTPTSLANVVEDSEELRHKFDRALAQIRREFDGATIQPSTIDKRIADAVPEQGHLKTAYALLAGKNAFIHDQALTARRITECAAQTLRIARAGIWLLDGAKTKIVCLDLYESTKQSHSTGPVLSAKDFQPYFQAVATERILDADDAVQDARTSCFADSYLRPLGISSMMDVPLWSRGALKGVLCCEHIGTPRRWNVADKNFGFFLTQIMSMHYEAK